MRDNQNRIFSGEVKRPQATRQSDLQIVLTLLKISSTSTISVINAGISRANKRAKLSRRPARRAARSSLVVPWKNAGAQQSMCAKPTAFCD